MSSPGNARDIPEQRWWMDFGGYGNFGARICQALAQERGLATVRSILSYCGKPFRQWHDEHWHTAYGWLIRFYAQP